MSHRVIWADLIECPCGCSIDMDHGWDYPGSPFVGEFDDLRALAERLEAAQ